MGRLCPIASLNWGVRPLHFSQEVPEDILVAWRSQVFDDLLFIRKFFVAVLANQYSMEDVHGLLNPFSAKDSVEEGPIGL